MTRAAAPPTGTARLPMIELGRALAAIAVVLFHADMIARANWPAGPQIMLFALGERGVDFFFVLSGFIITLVHADDVGHPDRAGRFALRRWMRIYPLLWLVAAATGAANLLLDGQGYGLASIWTSFTLWPSLAWPFPPIVWTLRHEMLFYALFGLLILSRRFGVVVVALWFVATLAQIALQLSGSSMPGLSALLFSPLNLQFAIGCGVALLYRAYGARYWRPALALGLVLLIGAGTMKLWLSLPARPVIQYIDGSSLIQDLVAGPIFGLICYGLAGVGQLRRTPRPILLLGASSYAIYLVHTPVGGVLGRLAPAILPESLLAVSAGQLVIALGGIAAGVAIHIVFEKPVGRWLTSRLLHRKVAAPHAPLVQARS